jgi:NAD(P)H-hydrate epimerase
MDMPKLPPRDPDAHKGAFGLALVVGGSRGMSGAAALAGMAALRGGAGLVRLAVPENCLDTVARFNPCYMTAPLPADAHGRIAGASCDRIVELAESATVLALGPGLGRSAELDELVPLLYRRIERPMVVDADALNALADSPQALSSPGGPRILTPHPGEFARLHGHMPRSSEERMAAAAELAHRAGVVVVLKGHRTCISDGSAANNGATKSNGAATALNTTGNPGMASGGSGDVLTGLIAALWCQGLSAFDAARLGAHLHGLAGDIAAERLGQISTIATDLIDALPEAIKTAACQ